MKKKKICLIICSIIGILLIVILFGKLSTIIIKTDQKKSNNLNGNEILQEKWENEEGTKTVIFSGGFENLNEISKKAITAKYTTKEYQRALFKNEVLYFDFTKGELAKNTKIKLNIYTGNIYITFKDLNNLALTKTILFTAEDGIKSLSFDDYGMLGESGDIQTLTIRTDSDIAILDYSIEINR